MKKVLKIIPLFIALFAGQSFATDTYNCFFTYLVKDQAGINIEIKVEPSDGFKEDSVLMPELNKKLSVRFERTKDSLRKGAYDVNVRLHEINVSSPLDPSKEVTLIGSLSKKSKIIYLSTMVYDTSYVFQCEKQ